MAQNLSRRKYSKLVRFLTDTMTSTTVSHRVRTAASVRLQNVYQHAELLAERAILRKEANEARERAELASTALPAIVAELVAPLTEEEQQRLDQEEKDRRTANVFAAIMGRDE